MQKAERQQHGDFNYRIAVTVRSESLIVGFVAESRQIRLKPDTAQFILNDSANQGINIGGILV